MSNFDQSIGADLPISRYTQTSEPYLTSDYTSYSSIGSTYDRSKAIDKAIGDFVDAHLPPSNYTQTLKSATVLSCKPPVKTVDATTSMGGDTPKGVNDYTSTEDAVITPKPPGFGA